MLKKLNDLRRRFTWGAKLGRSAPTRSGAFRVYDTAEIIQSNLSPIYVDIGALFYTAETDMQRQLEAHFRLNGGEFTDFAAELRKGILNDIINSDLYQKEQIIFEEGGRNFVSLHWLQNNLDYIAAFAPKSPFKKGLFNYIRKAIPELAKSAKDAQPDSRGVRKLVPSP